MITIGEDNNGEIAFGALQVGLDPMHTFAIRSPPQRSCMFGNIARTPEDGFVAVVVGERGLDRPVVEQCGVAVRSN